MRGEDEIGRTLGVAWEENAVREGRAEVRRMIEQKQLFTEDAFGQYDRGKPPRLSTICLNVSHKCNLRCRYRFAHGGDYGHEAVLMTRDVAERSVDFLIEESARPEGSEREFFRR